MTAFTHLAMIPNTWHEQQASERDRKQREAIRRRIQRKLYDEAYFGPFWK